MSYASQNAHQRNPHRLKGLELLFVWDVVCFNSTNVILNIKHEAMNPNFTAGNTVTEDLCERWQKFIKTMQVNVGFLQMNYVMACHQP
jgi:hypothetical protein